MSFFSAIGSLVDDEVEESIGDDNSAVSTAESNPFIETTVFGARKAYETMHNMVAPLIKGKNASIRTIDRQIKTWEKRLEKIAVMYEEMLNKLNDLSSDFEGSMTFDLAKEAWEIIQDTPILRRYMGEANYWVLYDTIGLLATQGARFNADMLATLKAALKAAILAVISMTDGLLCLETYIGLIQQWWGALYLKITPLPLLDSIVPNVTTAYWYKPTVDSTISGHRVYNEPPGTGFCPIPTPMPNPVMVTRNASYRDSFDYQNPDTWYLNGTPYYMPGTMDLLYRALNYWGSSYTNERLPIVSQKYTRRPYADGDHPLIVGRTFAQLDTSKVTINGTDIQTDTDIKSSDVSVIFGKVVTPEIAAVFNAWQDAYVIARKQFVAGINDFISEKATKGEMLTMPATLADMYAEWSELAEDDGTTYYESALKRASNYLLKPYDINSSVPVIEQPNVGGITLMNYCWQAIVSLYSEENDISDGSNYESFYDALMTAFMDAGTTNVGYKGSLDDDTFYITDPSFVPDNMSSIDNLDRYGVPGLTYVSSRKFTQYVDGTPKNAYILVTSKGSESGRIVEQGDYVQAIYHLSKLAFVMLPSTSDMDMDGYNKSIYTPRYVPNKAIVNLMDVPAGTYVDGPVGDTGTVLEYTYPQGMNPRPSHDPVIGPLADSLYKHRSCGPHYIKGEPYTMGSMLFPDGRIPSTDEDEASIRPETFVSIYNNYVVKSMDSNEELAEIIGYSIDKGREIKFPCFGVYGNLLSMKSFHYREMPSTEFTATYAKAKSGTSLYYKISDPSKIVFRHSTYMSQSRMLEFTIYHEPLDTESKSYTSGDSYKFHIFPTESIAVSQIPDHLSIGQVLSVDAVSPEGDKYHYVTFRNPIPKCAKYVNTEHWSIMDIVHEMLLLAQNLAGLCADNGKAYNQLLDDLSEFHISPAEFIGQLPENNGQFATFRFGIFQEYADEIESYIKTIYDFKAKIIAITEAW